MNYTIPIPRTNVTSSTQVNAAGHPIMPARQPALGGAPSWMSWRQQGDQPTYPTGYPPEGPQNSRGQSWQSWRNAGNGQQMSLADFGRRNVQESVHNPASDMYSSVPALAGMATPAEMQANQGLGQRWQKLAQQRNLQSLNTTLATEPVERQLDRSILAANMGLGHADLGRRMQASQDEYGLAKQGRKLSVARMLYQ